MRNETLFFIPHFAFIICLMRRFKAPTTSSGTRTLYAVILVIISIAVIIAGRNVLEPATSPILIALSPFQSQFANLYNAISNAINTPTDLASIQARNNELEKQVADLTTENIRLSESEARLKIVSALLDYARTSPERKYVTADVVGRDESRFLRYVLLNKGARDGLNRDMPVVTDKGLVELVTETTVNASKVVLITDLSSAVNVRLQNSRAEGVVLGQQSGELRLNYISVEVDMKQGERVVTSGLGGQFPQGLLIGTVASVRKRTFDVFQEADVKSAVDFNRLETVLVIINYEKPDIQPLIGTPIPPP